MPHPVDRPVISSMTLEEIITWIAALEAEFRIRVIEQKAGVTYEDVGSKAERPPGC